MYKLLDQLKQQIQEMQGLGFQMTVILARLRKYCDERDKQAIEMIFQQWDKLSSPEQP